MMGDLKDGEETKGAPEQMEAIDMEPENTENPIEEQHMAFTQEALKKAAEAILCNPMDSLPKAIKKTVCALKNIQLQHVLIEVDFFKELHELEVKYEKKFEPLYQKRSEIISGAYVPTEEECHFPSDSDTELSNEIGKITIEEVGDKTDSKEADIQGIPEFWLTALKNAPSVADMIEEYDEPILKHLTNIRAETYTDPMSFKLEFHFSPNEYFTNTVLTKNYILRCLPDEADVFAFEGPEIVKSEGCTIDWKKGKNVTVKTIKKKQKHKARGAVRTVTKTVANESFFNFFSPPPAPENENEVDEETQTILNNDFEVGNLIKDRLIPHAVLFFTGENLIDDDFDEDDEEEDEDEDEDLDEEEDEEDEEENDSTVNRKKSRGQSGNSQVQAPPECKTQ